MAISWVFEIAVSNATFVSFRASGAKSVASFVNLGLSLHTPGQFKPIKKQSSSSLLPRTAPAKSRA